MTDYIAGLDFGTSSVKLVVLTPSGEEVYRAQQSYDTVVGPTGEMEQNPEHWWDAARRALRSCAVRGQIAVLGVTGQMQDLIAVDHTGAVRAAMLYSDTRAGSQHERLMAALPDWERVTGNHQDVSNVAAKIAWLAEHEPHNLDRTAHFLFGAAGYIVWRAGGAAACDLTTASTTGLLDVHSREWRRDIVEASGARLEQLPRLVGASSGDEIVGAISAAAAADLGIAAGTPLVLALGDAGATTDGLVGSDPGDAYLYLGTTGWLAAVTQAGSERPSPIHSLVMPGWENRLRIGAVQAAGSAAAWALATFLPGRDFAAAESLVSARVDCLDARPLCLPGIAGERTPIRDGAFRGAFVGVHEASDPVDFYLAALTGVAMGLRHAADDMGIRQRRIPLVGGAASSPAWRRIVANVFDATVITRVTTDPGSHAAARAAASALGIVHQLRPLFTPDEADVETAPSAAQPSYERLLASHRLLYDALAPTFHRLSNQHSPSTPLERQNNEVN